MPYKRILQAWIWASALYLLPAAVHGETWNSPHISVTKLSSWSEFLTVINQPHIDVTIHNDGTAAVGTLDFRCRLFLLDRATPVFDGGWSTTLDRVIRPGEDQSLKLEPNMFSKLGEVIERDYSHAAWSCYASRILTAEGQSISFEPGALPRKGPAFGIGYAPVPQAMVGPLKLPDNNGMWVLKVQTGSTADTLGIRVGDVVVSIDGKPLKVVQDLTSALDQAAASGRAADLTVIRAGALIHVSVFQTAESARN